eukprot:3940308-Rhodomonas_salina.5
MLLSAYVLGGTELAYFLRACDAMCCTELGYQPTRVLRHTRYSHRISAYAHAMQCAVLSSHMAYARRTPQPVLSSCPVLR